MAFEKAAAYLKQRGKEDAIFVFDTSSATVELAAQALGVEACRIAKSLTFEKDDGCVLIVAAGNRRIDNKKFKEVFGCKAKMLSPEQVEKFTGYQIGGVCPFGIENEKTKIYLDVSLKEFDTVYPACGSDNSAVRVTPEELEKLVDATAWVDVCKLPQ